MVKTLFWHVITARFINTLVLLEGMGRIKTQQIKRATFDLMGKYGDSFKPDFNENKKLLSGFAEIRSKKLRNMIAGYVTRLVKSGKVE